jgi:thiamine-monophosphate kinase
MAQALHGGKDYELLFTAPPRKRIPAEFEGVPLSRIGFIGQDSPGSVTIAGRTLPPLGYDHFEGRAG